LKAASPRLVSASFSPFLPSLLHFLSHRSRRFLLLLLFLRLATGLVKSNTLWRIFIRSIVRLYIPLSLNDKSTPINSRASLLCRRRQQQQQQQQTSFIPIFTLQNSDLGPALLFRIASVTAENIYHIPFIPTAATSNQRHDIIL